MDNHNQEFFIPGLELISLTDDCYDDDYYENCANQEDPVVEYLDDCESQENLFQIISLTPEETRIDQDNHIIPADIHVFFEELGFICEEPDSIDPTRDYEAEYKERMDLQQQQLIKNGKARRQHHIDLESIPTPSSSTQRTVSAQRQRPSIDTTPSPGLSSASSSFHHTDDDHYEDDDVRLPLYVSRLSHMDNTYHSASISKPTVPHFSFTTARF
ncbi:hypothetical protein BCR42DRAFT_407093 [Absidia repens]|uniref:Uncharacterized protein n=1 Tax=Absidia repens TaxID=90262 RepID=A0A1X2IRT7_9FUNG|nr:hypothetical protein BCR42DRAFT_407093 [Absidia repens]